MLLGLVYALLDSGASLNAARADASLFLDSLPHASSSVRAVLADGSSVTSRGLVTLSLGIGQSSFSLFLERILGGQELIFSPGCLQRHCIGLVVDSVPDGDAYLVFAALRPAVWVKLLRRNNCWYLGMQLRRRRDGSFFLRLGDFGGPPSSILGSSLGPSALLSSLSSANDEMLISDSCVEVSSSTGGLWDVCFPMDRASLYGISSGGVHGHGRSAAPDLASQGSFDSAASAPLPAPSSTASPSRLEASLDGSSTGVYDRAASDSSPRAASSPPPPLLGRFPVVRDKGSWDSTFGYPGEDARRILHKHALGVVPYARCSGSSVRGVREAAHLRARPVPGVRADVERRQWLPLELFTFDFTRFYKEATFEGEHLGVLFACALTARPLAFLLVNHSGIIGALDALKAWVPAHSSVDGRRLRAIYGDYDPTFLRHENFRHTLTSVETWCRDNGVLLLTSPPYKHNRLVENLMGLVLFTTNALLIGASLSHLLWGRAFLHAVYLIARRPLARSRKPALAGGKTPFEAAHGYRPDLSVVLGPFGSTVYANIPGASPSQHSRVAKQGLLLGIAASENAWVVLFLEDMMVRTVYNLKIDRRMDRRPALLAERQAALNSQAALVSPDVRKFYQGISALFDSYPTGSSFCDKALVLDPLTNLPLRFEIVNLGGGERGLVEVSSDAVLSPGNDPASSTASRDIPFFSRTPEETLRPRLLNGPFNRKRDAATPAERSKLRGLPDDTPLEFQQVNPKQVGTASYVRYDQYKVATTLGAAKNLGLSLADLVNDFERGYVLLSRLALFALLTCDVDESSVEAGLVKGLDWLAATKTDALPASVLTDPSSRSDDATGFGSSFTSNLDNGLGDNILRASFIRPSMVSSFNSFCSDSSLPPALPVQPPRYTGMPAAGTPASTPHGWINQEDFIDRARRSLHLTPEQLMVFESPADFAERTAIRISQSFEEFEDNLAATEGRHPSPAPSVVQQADLLLKSLLLSTDFEQVFEAQSTDVPASVNEALRGPDSVDWKAKLRDEWFRMFEHFRALDPVDFSEVTVPLKELVPMKWVLDVKTKADGSFNRRKARLVACEVLALFTVTDKFSPTVMAESVRLLLHILVTYNCWAFLVRDHGCDEPVSDSNPLHLKQDLRKPVGLILYIALACRSDVAFPSVFLSRYVGKLDKQTRAVAKAVDRLGWFIVHTKDTHVLRLSRSDATLRGAVDASFANDAGTMLSWYGYALFFGRPGETGAFGFKSSLARLVVASTRDAELIAAVHAIHHIVALRLFLAESGFPVDLPTEVTSDSLAAVQGARLPHLHRNSRWMAIRFQVIKQTVRDMLVKFQHGPGSENSADIYTKILAAAPHLKHAMTVLGQSLRALPLARLQAFGSGVVDFKK